MPNVGDEPGGTVTVPAVLRVSEPAQLKALGHEMRTRILALLLERDATVSQLADALAAPVGTVGHHLGVLQSAGLVEVSRTRQVRGIVERHYRRTARLFLLDAPLPAGAEIALRALDEARAEARVDVPAGLVPKVAVAYARVPRPRVEEFRERLLALLAEFRDEPAADPVTWGMVVGLFPTARRPLPPEPADDGEEA